MSRLLRIALVAAAAVLIGGGGAQATGSSTVVISQVYGGGGLTNATYTNDYVELHNVGNSDVSLSGMSLQYASAAGTTWQTLSLTGTVDAGGYYLIGLASGGSTGISLPTTDQSGTINMANAAGKVALVPSTTAITTGTTCPVTTGVPLTDFVGYGTTATCAEGSNAPAPSASTADVRGDSGCTDTDDNSADFSATLPNPRNSASDLHFCVADDAPTVTATTPTDSATGVATSANVVVDFSEAISHTTSWFTISCTSSGSHTATTTDSSSTELTLDPDADFANGETCTVTVLASEITDQDLNDPPDAMTADYAFSFTIVDGTPTQYVVTSDSYSPTAGSGVTISAQLADANGNPVHQASHTVDWGTTGSGGSLGAGSSLTNSSGVATVTFTTSTVSGTTQTVTATDDADGSLIGATSDITTVPGPADHLDAFASAQFASGDPGIVHASILDANGNIVTSDNSTQVTFAQTGGTGSVDGLGTTTVVNGEAQRTITGKTAGTVQIDVSAPGLSNVTVAPTIVPGTPDHLAFTSSTAALTSGVNRLLTAEIRDANENVITSDSSTSVDFVVGSGPGTLSNLPKTVTASGGKASVTVTGVLAGSVTVKAKVSGLPDGTTTFTVVAAAADHLTFTSSTAALASATSRALTVEIRDLNQNKVTSPSASVTFTKSSGSGTVSGLTTVSSANGVATDSIKGVIAGPITISATTGNLSASTTFTVVPGAPHHLSFTSSTAALPFGSARTLTAEVRDANNNKVTTDSGRTVSFAKNSGAGNVSGLGTALTSNGLASKSVTASGSGTITIGATASPLGGATSTFAVLAQDGSGTMTTPTIRVANGSSGNTITFTYVAAAGGISSGTVALTVPSGWSVPVTSPATAPGYVTATAGVVTLSSRTILVSGLTLAAGAKLQVVYGVKSGGGPGAVAPTAGGAQTWVAKSKASAGGVLKNLAASPSINVLARDGSGALTTPTTSVKAGATGITITFTYTAAAGGIFNGQVAVTVPTGWSAPSLTGTQPGFVKPSLGTASLSGRTIVISGLTRAGGQTFTITYGAKGGGGPGAAAPATAVGAQSWAAKSKASGSGTLKSLAASPSITVSP